jgi:hypothetical protein
MKKQLVGIIVFMLVATTVASATKMTITETSQTKTSQEMTSLSNTLNGYQPTPLNWGVDQKQTHTDGSGLTLYPPEVNAQSFTPTKDKLTAVSLWLFKYASPPEPDLITVAIRDNLTGPDLATKTINTSVVTISTKGTWVLFDFDDITLTPETKYYIICTGIVGNPTNAYCWLFSANDTYTRGEAWYKANENFPWNINHAIGDFCFKTYFRKPFDISIPKNNGNIRSGVYSVDVPIWKQGDSWTYELRSQCYTYNTNGTVYSTCLENATETWTVTAVNNDNYTLQIIDNNISGKFYFGPYRWIFTKFMKTTWEDILRKTDLAEIQNTWVFKGLIFWLISKLNLPIPAQFSVSTQNIYSPPQTLMPFPLIAGTNGTLPNVHTTGYQKCTLYWGLITPYNIPNVSGDTGSRKYTCEMENITVPAGAYTSYNASVTYNSGLIHDYWRSYYVPEIGSFAKRSVHIDYAYNKPYLIQEWNLVSTTYTP